MLCMNTLHIHTVVHFTLSKNHDNENNNDSHSNDTDDITETEISGADAECWFNLGRHSDWLYTPFSPLFPITFLTQKRQRMEGIHTNTGCTQDIP